MGMYVRDVNVCRGRIDDIALCLCLFFFFSSRRRHTRCSRDWSSDVCSSDLFVVFLWLSKLASVFSPNHYSKDWLRIRFVQIEKRWVSFRRLRIPGANHLAANGRRLAKVLFRLGCG